MDVQEAIRMLFNLPELPTPDHAADALAVALCHASTSSFLSILEKGRA